MCSVRTKYNSGSLSEGPQFRQLGGHEPPYHPPLGNGPTMLDTQLAMPRYVAGVVGFFGKTFCNHTFHAWKQTVLTSRRGFMG